MAETDDPFAGNVVNDIMSLQNELRPTLGIFNDTNR